MGELYCCREMDTCERGRGSAWGNGLGRGVCMCGEGGEGESEGEMREDAVLERGERSVMTGLKSEGRR